MGACGSSSSKEVPRREITENSGSDARDGLPKMAPFNMAAAVPLITGGGSGIGRGLVDQFIKMGAKKVLITGRREEKLLEVAEAYPDQIEYLVNDVGKEEDRLALYKWVKKSHNDCNILVNNAGMQRLVAPAQEKAPWSERGTEIEVNLAAPIHLCSLFIPFFIKQREAMIINLTSSLAFVPFAAAPVYSATKAALHNYTMALRVSLNPTSLRLVEVIPPMVRTNLPSSRAEGEDRDEFCQLAMERVADGYLEVGFKSSDRRRMADRITNYQSMAGVAIKMEVEPFQPQHHRQ